MNLKAIVNKPVINLKTGEPIPEGYKFPASSSAPSVAANWKDVVQPKKMSNAVVATAGLAVIEPCSSAGFCTTALPVPQVPPVPFGL
jgi:hypothetical protein